MPTFSILVVFLLEEARFLDLLPVGLFCTRCFEGVWTGALETSLNGFLGSVLVAYGVHAAFNVFDCDAHYAVVENF